jgi:hypothetical protein
MASNRRFGQPEKLIKPCPPTNIECQCHEIGTPEGQYQLVHECYLDTIAPQFTTGTHVSIFCPKSTKAMHSHSPSCSINNTNNSSEDILSYPNNLSGDYFSSASSQEIPTLHLPSPQKNTSSDTSWHFTLTKSPTTTTSTVSPVLTPLHPSVSDPHYLLPNSAAPNLNSPQRSPTSEKEGFNFSSSPLEKTGTSFSSFFGGQPATPTTRSRSLSPAHKRKHPKTSFNKLKSSFIDYITTNDEYAATMADTSALSSCSIFNVGVNFCIVDDKSKQKVR